MTAQEAEHLSVTKKVAPAISAMTAEIREVVSQRMSEPETGAGVADVLSRWITRSDLLHPENREGDPESYCQHILHVEPDGSFSVVCLVWLPHQVTPIHDHVSWCVVGVHEGEEAEERFRVGGDSGESHLELEGTGVNPEGLVVWLSPPGDIHRVRNTGDGKTISLHVYGADISVLRTSIRHEYDLPIKS